MVRLCNQLITSLSFPRRKISTTSENKEVTVSATLVLAADMTLVPSASYKINEMFDGEECELAK